MISLVVILGVGLAALGAAYTQLRQRLEDLEIKSGKIEEKARHKAEKIVENAREKGLEIVEEAKMEEGEIKRRLEEGMEKVNEKQLGEYGRILYDEARKAVEEYKSKRLKDVDAKIYEMLEKVAREVTGKSINMEQHKELIMEALEEAKKQNVFG